MEKQSRKKNVVSKRVSTCLVVALFVVGVVGLYSFTPNTNEKNTTKIPDISRIVENWKTYSNSYLTFNYPDTYKITDEEESEDSYELCCEIKNDDLVVANISVTEMGDLSDMSETLLDLTLTMGVQAAIEELQKTSYYKNFSHTDIKKVTKGCHTGMSTKYTASIYGIPIQGEVFMAYSGHRLLTVVEQAENANYMSQLDQIVEGIRVK